MNADQKFLSYYHDGCQGDQKAFTHFVQQAAPQLRGYLKRVGVESNTVDDAVQRTVFEAYRQAGRFESAVALRAWLFATVRHIGLQERRAAQRAAALNGDALQGILNALPTSAPPHQDMDKAEQSKQVQTAVRKLPAYLQEILELYYYQEFGYREIAQVTGHSVDVLRQYIMRIHKNLRNLL